MSQHLSDRRDILRLAASTCSLALFPPGCSSAAYGGDDVAEPTPEGRALQARIDLLAQQGGGTVQLEAGRSLTASDTILVRDNVSLDLNGQTLIIQLRGGNAVGVRLRSGATVMNGRIVVRSSGQPGISGAIHAPVVIGALYGEGGTPDRPSPDEGVHGWAIRNLILSSDKNTPAMPGQRIGAVGIQIIGGAHDGVIENITIPDSAVMAGGIHLDWGFVGPISAAAIEESAQAYRAGRAHTTHPHRIAIRGIRVGRLSRALTAAGGSFGVRLSGVHDVEVMDVHVVSTTEAAFYHTAGDLGFEFALPAARDRGCKGIVVRDGVLDQAMSGYLIWSNSYADNVGREVERGYRPMLKPIHNSDIRFQNIKGAAVDPGRAPYGVRVDHQIGGRIVDCTAQGFGRGFFIDEQVYDLDLVRPVAVGNAVYGISVGHPLRPPARIRVSAPVAKGNRDCGIVVERSADVEIVGGDVAASHDQACGVRLSPTARNAFRTAR